MNTVTLLPIRFHKVCRRRESTLMDFRADNTRHHVPVLAVRFPQTTKPVLSHQKDINRSTARSSNSPKELFISAAFSFRFCDTSAITIDTI